eukprot:3776606-Pleurochrysis_carterae.AAC.3
MGLGTVAGAVASRACGRSPVRGAGDGDVGHALGDWKLRAQRASARKLHYLAMRAQNGKCACEMN